MTDAEVNRSCQLCLGIVDAYQAGTQTKQAYLDAFAEVLALEGGPVEAHGVLLGCAEDPSWAAEVKAAFRARTKALEALEREREARKAVAAALDAAAAHDDVDALLMALREADKMPEWDLLSDRDQMALSTVVSGLIQAAADMDKTREGAARVL